MFGTLVLVTWAIWTRLMMRLLGLSRRDALYIGGVAGWAQEAFIFVPRFAAAPALTTLLAPLISSTYMQLMLWPLEAYAEKLPNIRNGPLRWTMALIGILTLEVATVAPLARALVPAPVAAR